jgi:hypothetical protein
MSGVTSYLHFSILVAAGVAGVITAALTAVLEDHLKYLIRRLFRLPTGESPPPINAWIWVAYTLSILVFVIGGAFTAIELLPRPSVYITSPVEVGKHATVTVKTLAGVDCSIEYFLPSGEKSTSQELVPKKADANGICAWCWQIGTNTNPGTGRVTITVGDENQKSYSGEIEIVEQISSP